MASAAPEEDEMRFMLLQEALWNNGDVLNRVLEHVIAQESYLLRLLRLTERIAQRFELLNNGTKSTSKQKHGQE
jgi:hypothetical protein